MPSLGDVFRSPRLDGDSVYDVSIKVIRYEDLMVARRRFDQEFASLIRVGSMELSCLYDRTFDVMGLGFVCLLPRSCVVFRSNRGSFVEHILFFS